MATNPHSVQRSATAPVLALGSMLTFQAVTAVSVPLLLAVGPTAMTSLRLLGASGILWVIARPTLSMHAPASLAAAGRLGAATCGMSLFFAEAIARIPLGMAAAIEFVGPLAVAIAASRKLRHVGWAGMAAAGVALITLSNTGWSGDPHGIFYAAVAAACWAAYILLMKRIGHAFSGLQGLTISLTAAALLAAPFGFSQFRSTASVWEVLASVALGALVPLLPYGFELLALRRMSTRSFGILMSADPAISSLMGWLVLHQSLNGQKLLGIASVVLASARTHQRLRATPLLDPEAARMASFRKA